MTDRRVIFKAEKVTEGAWQIVCHCPDGEIEYVTGFSDERAIESWLQDARREYWLKARDFQQ
jgi:hypothetical protein